MVTDYTMDAIKARESWVKEEKGIAIRKTVEGNNQINLTKSKSHKAFTLMTSHKI